MNAITDAVGGDRIAELETDGLEHARIAEREVARSQRGEHQDRAAQQPAERAPPLPREHDGLALRIADVALTQREHEMQMQEVRPERHHAEAAVPVAGVVGESVAVEALKNRPSACVRGIRPVLRNSTLCTPRADDSMLRIEPGRWCTLRKCCSSIALISTTLGWQFFRNRLASLVAIALSCELRHLRYRWAGRSPVHTQIRP